jgi:putative ATPase
LLSALHKSLRGSDPDAAAYWVERLLVAGEDPRVVARRLVRMASEDVGLADPAALGIALDALAAVQFLGLPEGDAALVQAAVYLALAPKSDAVYRACLAARAAAQARPDLGVPLELRNAPTPLLRELGAGRGYVSPHEVEAGFTAQEHLPAELAGQRFFEPGERGAEAELRRRLSALRAARERARSGAPRAKPAAPPGTPG